MSLMSRRLFYIIQSFAKFPSYQLGLFFPLGFFRIEKKKIREG